MSGYLDNIRDEIAILEIRQGDGEALRRLIERYQRRLHAYISMTLGDGDAAWDVSQEVWLEAVKALRGGRDIECFAAWLYGVAHNKCVTYFRRAGRAAEAAAQDATEDAGTEREAPDVAFHAEEAALVREAIGDLPLAQREAVTLYYLDDMSVEAVAGILGLPPGTVQSRLHYARKSLRAFLERKGLGNER